MTNGSASPADALCVAPVRAGSAFPFPIHPSLAAPVRAVRERRSGRAPYRPGQEGGTRGDRRSMGPRARIGKAGGLPGKTAAKDDRKVPTRPQRPGAERRGWSMAHRRAMLCPFLHSKG